MNTILRTVPLAALLVWWPALFPGLLLGQAASSPSPSPAASEDAILGPPGCPWPEVSGKRLLDHPLGPLAFTAATTWEIVHRLVREHHVPLSFIETDSE